MNAKIWVSQAYATFKKYPWIFIGITAIEFVLNGVLSGIPRAGIFVSALFSCMVMASWVLIISNEKSGNKPKLEDIFSAFKKEYFVKLLILTALLIVLGALLFIPLVFFGIAFSALSAAAFAFSSNLWGAVLATLGLSLALIYMVFYLFLVSSQSTFALPLVMLQKKEPWDAIVLSVKTGYKNILPLSYLWLIYSGLVILCFLTLGLGFVVVLPLIKIANFNAYLETLES